MTQIARDNIHGSGRSEAPHVTSLALTKRVRIAMVSAIAYAADKYFAATFGR